MKTLKTPLFTHDCNNCEFLGTFENHDLYFCDIEQTVIARYGNDGPDYMSGMTFAHNGRNGIPILYEAKLRAINQGLYSEENKKN